MGEGAGLEGDDAKLSDERVKFDFTTTTLSASPFDRPT